MYSTYLVPATIQRLSQGKCWVNITCDYLAELYANTTARTDTHVHRGPGPRVVDYTCTSHTQSGRYLSIVTTFPGRGYFSFLWLQLASQSQAFKFLPQPRDPSMTRQLKQPSKKNTERIIGDKNIPLGTHVKREKSGVVRSQAPLAQRQKKMGFKGGVHTILSPLKAGSKSLHTKTNR